MSSPAREDNVLQIMQQGVTPRPARDLWGDVAERQKALVEIQDRLQSGVASASAWAKWTRIAVIFLGAFAATREGADGIFAPGSRGDLAVTLTYTLMALAITVIGSVNAAFRFADKASELNALAAECNQCLLEVDCQMPTGDEPADEARRKARELVTKQNEKLGRIQRKAARVGVEVRRVSLDSVR
ncbi:MAG: hypothetical protein M3416_12760 [Acidobacteriota bacterium]|nr:hypothetical protein [Acidobacteriota bacterium]